MKKTLLLLAIAGFLTSCLQDKGYRPLRSLRSFKLEEGERREVTGWYIYRKMLINEVYALVREESHTFTDGATGIAYTVFDPEFNELGRISAGGQVKKYVKHRRTQTWREVDLGSHEILHGVSLLLDFNTAQRRDTEIVQMTLNDVRRPALKK